MTISQAIQPKYYLHGDQEKPDSPNYFCRMCDIFAGTGHFHDEHHKQSINKSLKQGINFIAIAERPLRPENWPNLFDRNLMLLLDELNSTSSKRTRRKGISPNTRFEILKRDKYKCQICGKNQKHGVTLHIDHRIAVANGGTNNVENLWVLCSPCNLGKGVNYL